MRAFTMILPVHIMEKSKFAADRSAFSQEDLESSRCLKQRR